MAESVFAGGSVWFLIKFMSAIPNDLVAMGRLDGLGPFGMLRHVIVPMTVPALTALGAMGVVGAWQSYLWPLLLLRREELMVLPVGVREVIWYQVLQNTQINVNVGIAFAGAVIATLPGLILFLLTQKYFISGLFAKSTGGD